MFSLFQFFFPLALQPSADYGLLWLCSPVRAMASSGSAAHRGLWPPVALQPSVGYGLLWLCSPSRAMVSSDCSPAPAMASSGFAAQRGLWPPLALQSIAGYGLLVSQGFMITHNDALQSVGLLWTSDQSVAGTSI
jgi:hypothetical protein